MQMEVSTFFILTQLHLAKLPLEKLKKIQMGIKAIATTAGA
jgi:hypothetical protein